MGFPKVSTFMRPRPPRTIRKISVGFLSVWVLLGVVSPSWAQERVRAKLGIQIQSGDRVAKAKAQDRIISGDRLRIYVIPRDDVYVYVVHTDTQRVTLLTSQPAQAYITGGKALILPSTQAYYQVDGASPSEAFTIICSPEELVEMSRLRHGEQMSYAAWSALEEKLIDRSKIDLSDRSEKPFPIAGTVRGVSGAPIDDPFLKRLRVFSGKSLLVKTYAFRIKK